MKNPISPKKYQVILLNDSKTPTEFLVNTLQTVFHKSPYEASQIMMDIHLKGNGCVGTYTYEVAETRLANMLTTAKKSQHPLKGEIEAFR